MTLTTTVVIHDPLPVRRVWDRCRQLIGADHDGYIFTHEDRPRDYENPATFNPAYRARLGQGYPALLWLYYGPDGPLRRHEDSDRPPGFIEVQFDTGYGRGVSDFHAWLVRELGRWLDEEGKAWSWQNEYTGEWFCGENGLETLGNADRGPELLAVNR